MENLINIEKNDKLLNENKSSDHEKIPPEEAKILSEEIKKC